MPKKTELTNKESGLEVRRLTDAQFQGLAQIPPEVEWFANIRNPNTRKSYRQDIQAFMTFVGIERPEEFRGVTRAHVIAWRDQLEAEGRAPVTIRRKLSALSSLFQYLCNENAVLHNPVAGVSRPGEGANEGKTPAIGDAQARALLNAPSEDTLKGTRDRAILATFLFQLSQQLGRFNLVGTTAQAAERLPEHIAADEKHTCWNGEAGYIATTVGCGCFWGASLSLGVDESSLCAAYGVFKREAQGLDQDYEPKTVNTDGFQATRNAWLSLFTQSVLILCFLHGFLSIRDRARRLSTIFPELAQRVWDAYRQLCYEDFIDQVTVLQWWTEQRCALLPSCAFQAVMKLCGKAHAYALSYDHPGCLRTSNMLDRLMQKMDRYLFMLRYFHGHLHSAELSIRAWALAHNFLPYCSRSARDKPFIFPVHALNGMVYRDNWLENLLVSTSLGGKVGRTQNPSE